MSATASKSVEEKEALILQLLAEMPSLKLASINERISQRLKVNFVSILPHELTSYIMSYLPLQTLLRCSRVSKAWNSICSDNDIWRTLYKRNTNWYINTLYLDSILQQMHYDPGLLTPTLESLELPSAVIQDGALKSVSNFTLDRDGILTGSLPRSSEEKEQYNNDVSLETSNTTIYSPKSIKMPLIYDYNLPPVMFLPPSSPRSLSPDSNHKHANLNWNYIFKQRYLLERNWRNGNVCARHFTGHAEAIYCLQFDDEKVISGSKDHSIIIWDIKEGKIVSKLHGHQGSVLCLQYCKNILVSGSSDANILIWDLSNLDTEPKVLVGHQESVLQVRIYGDYLVSCSKDKTIKIWDMKQGICLRTLNGHRAAVNSIEVKDGVVISGSGDRLIKVWDFETGANLRTLEGHSRGIACIQFDGKIIASGSSDQTIKIWDFKTGQVKKTLQGHSDLVRTLQFHDNILVSGSYDCCIKIWDIETGKHLMDLFEGGHTSRVFRIAFDACRVVSCSQDSRIIVWDFSMGIDTKFFT